ncbi:hypothetical protein O9929_07390 [Vibrio lentus]|nr:hypothetical protein [Vibrio lentus]
MQKLPAMKEIHTVRAEKMKHEQNKNSKDTTGLIAETLILLKTLAKFKQSRKFETRFGTHII